MKLVGGLCQGKRSYVQMLFIVISQCVAFININMDHKALYTTLSHLSFHTHIQNLTFTDGW